MFAVGGKSGHRVLAAATIGFDPKRTFLVISVMDCHQTNFKPK